MTASAVTDPVWLSSPETEPRAGTSELLVHRDARGYPAVASASCHVAAPLERVFAVVSAVSEYTALVPMLHDVKLERGVATVSLRVGLGLLGSNFSFVARVEQTPMRAIELVYVSGAPAEFRLRFEVTPAASGASTVLRTTLGFDPDSLGWLASLFAKRHPELRFGIVPGCALALLESTRLRAEACGLR